jgi:uncharacterized DUF497 family protein
MRIVWDEPKRLDTLARRGLDFARLDAEFFENAVTTRAKEGRVRAIGRFEATIVTVIFQPLGNEGVAVISMRKASRKERKGYEAEDPPADR